MPELPSIDPDRLVRLGDVLAVMRRYEGHPLFGMGAGYVIDLVEREFGDRAWPARVQPDAPEGSVRVGQIRRLTLPVSWLGHADWRVYSIMDNNYIGLQAMDAPTDRMFTSDVWVRRWTELIGTEWTGSIVVQEELDG
jgi:hypothetical protein